MKIDMNIKAIRWMLSCRDVNDGCDVIRGVLAHTVLALFLSTLALIALTIAGFVLVGTVLYIAAPWYGDFGNVDLSLSYLGGSVIADCVRTGAFVGIVFLGAAAAVGIGFGICYSVAMGLKIAADAIYDARRTIRVAKVNQTQLSPTMGLVITFWDTLHTLGRSICPTIELSLPPEVERILKPGAVVSINDHKYTAKIYYVGTNHISFDLQPVIDSDDENPYMYDDLSYDFERKRFDLQFDVIDPT